MLEQAIDISSFLILIVPGAIAVWSFRHFIESKKQGDFEYLALSAFWGIVIAGLHGWVKRDEIEALEKLLANPLAANIVFSISGFIGGWLASRIVKAKKEDWPSIKERFMSKIGK